MAKRQRKKREKYKSGLEEEFAKRATSLGLPVDYECKTFDFTIDTTYTPDFKIRDNYFVETKGFFKPVTRSRLLHFLRQHPKVTIHLVFQDPSKKISKVSRTTYGTWADKHGIPWTHIKEVNNQTFNDTGLPSKAGG